MRVVVDASVAARLSLEDHGFALLATMHDLVAPPLLWSETLSVVHELRWREAVSARLAAVARTRLLAMPVERIEPASHREETWRIADEAGWAKTYDAEYVALARLLDCRLLSGDERLRRGAGRVVEVLAPADL